jgi:protein YibB
LEIDAISAARAAERLDLPLTLAPVAEVVWPPPSAPRRMGAAAPEADDVTIVTAFFDIGRGDWRDDAPPGARFRRSVDDYFAMFARLAKLKNQMIVFTEPRLAERALEARRASGLEHRTVVVAIPGLFDSGLVAPVGAAIGRRMNDLFRHWVTKPESPEYREPRYVLVNALKAAFVCAALDLGLVEAPQVAWIDFGYCRDDQRFDPAEPWRFDASGKINLFHIVALDETPITRVVRYGTVYFQGCHIVGPAEAWPALAKEMSTGLAALLACDLIDDDQTLLLMAWRKSPQSYRIHPVHSKDWFVVFRRFRSGAPIETFALRPGPRVRVESSLREELRIALKRWEKRVKRLRRLGRR